MDDKLAVIIGVVFFALAGVVTVYLSRRPRISAWDRNFATLRRHTDENTLWAADGDFLNGAGVKDAKSGFLKLIKRQSPFFNAADGPDDVIFGAILLALHYMDDRTLLTLTQQTAEQRSRFNRPETQNMFCAWNIAATALAATAIKRTASNEMDETLASGMATENLLLLWPVDIEELGMQWRQSIERDV
ncbi:hypothetical protein [uncultured Martelella sp.]|uniref:hypothetical protein n=1 Tax=uncultured Martelella sp. TaxID=392331 RepID=UPI0029C7B003|nr:hypothetical protein [uncultured Martelella sp.]